MLEHRGAHLPQVPHQSTDLLVMLWYIPDTDPPDPPDIADTDPQAQQSQEGEDAGHYQQLYCHLQREYTELQRSHQRLQTRLQPSPATDLHREEKNLACLRNRLVAAQAKVVDLENVLKADGEEERRQIAETLVEEKQALVQV